MWVTHQEGLGGIKLYNPSNSKVLFKIQTNRPKYYYVKPVNGAVEPSASVTITVTCRGERSEDINEDYDKILVQSVSCTPEEERSLLLSTSAIDDPKKKFTTLWKSLVDRRGEEGVHKKMVDCVRHRISEGDFYDDERVGGRGDDEGGEVMLKSKLYLLNSLSSSTLGGRLNEVEQRYLSSLINDKVSDFCIRRACFDSGHM